MQSKTEDFSLFLFKNNTYDSFDSMWVLFGGNIMEKFSRDVERNMMPFLFTPKHDERAPIRPSGNIIQLGFSGSQEPKPPPPHPRTDPTAMIYLIGGRSHRSTTNLTRGNKMCDKSHPKLLYFFC